MNSLATRWPPRLARLYSADVKRLEAKHAGKLSPGATTWEDAVKQLYKRVHEAGPRKGARIIGQAADYLGSVYENEGAHFMVANRSGSRAALLVFATFVGGDHPDLRVKEQGITITLHIIQCGRSLPRCVTGVPVAYISSHALKRLCERADDVVEPGDAAYAVVYAGILGYLVHRSPKHQDGGLSLRISDTLLVGSLHRFEKLWHNGHTLEEIVLDIRTVLDINELGDSQVALLKQGQIASEVVAAWIKNDVPERELASRIPALPRREDSYPARTARSFCTGR